MAVCQSAFLELKDRVRLDGEHIGHSAVVVLPGKSRPAEESDYHPDSLVVVLETPLEDRLMVSNPVSQGAKPVERVVESSPVPYSRCEDTVQIGSPDCRVVGIGKQCHPKPKGQCCDHSTSRGLFTKVMEELNSFIDLVLFSSAKK